MIKRSFASATVILTISAFIVKILGFAYRLFLSNLIGAEGMGLFQLIFPVYSLIVLTLTSGVSIAVSKMVAEQCARNDFYSTRRITKYALVMVVGCGTLVSIGLYLSTNYLANNMLKDARTYSSLLALVPCIPVIVSTSAFKGYFYAVNRVVPTALSQISEQIAKIAFIIIFSQKFLHLALSDTCMLATVSIAIGEIVNLVILVVSYRFKDLKEIRAPKSKDTLSRRNIAFRLIENIAPVSFNRLITSAMSAIELILIPQMLVKYGLSYAQSMCEFGKLTGMAMPLIFFPCLFTSSLATTLVPAISQTACTNNFRLANHRISKSIQISNVLGFIFMSMFLVFPEEIGNILYKKESIGEILKILSFTCVFTYLQQTLLGILNGLDKQVASLRNSIVGYIIRIIFVWFAIPWYGINSYILGTCVSLAVVCILNIIVISKATGISIDIRNWIIKPIVIGMVIISINQYERALLRWLHLTSLVGTMLAIAINCCIGVMLMISTGIVERADVARIFKPSTS